MTIKMTVDRDTGEISSDSEILARMQIHEKEILRYDGLIGDMAAELKQLKKMREEQLDSLRELARGQMALPLEGE